MPCWRWVLKFAQGSEFEILSGVSFLLDFLYLSCGSLYNLSYNMVSLESFGADHSLLKNFSGCERMKCSQAEFKGGQAPVYCFGSQLAFRNDAPDIFPCVVEDQSLLNSLLLAQYEDHMWKGVIGYDVTACESKVTSGLRKFVAQLNELWRPNICMHFGEENIPLQEELLFCVVVGQKRKSELIPSDRVPSEAYLVLVNANPIEYGHVFLVPQSYKRPQSQFASSLEIAVNFASEIKNCSLRAFYDYPGYFGSTCGFFQACYLANPLAVELVPIVPISGVWQEVGMMIFEVAGYPLKAIQFEVEKNLESLVKITSEICLCLIDQNCPFSILISHCGSKIFLFPQVSSAPTLRNLSAWECSGHFIFNKRSDFDGVSEETLVKQLAAFSVDEDNFQSVKQLCCNIAIKLLSELKECN